VLDRTIPYFFIAFLTFAAIPFSLVVQKATHFKQKRSLVFRVIGGQQTNTDWIGKTSVSSSENNKDGHIFDHVFIERNGAL